MELVQFLRLMWTCFTADMNPWNDFVKQYSWNAMSYMNLTADQPDVELTWFPDRWLQFSTDEPKPWLGHRSGNPALAFENVHGRQLYNLFWTCVDNKFLCMVFFFAVTSKSYSSMWLSLSPCFLCNVSVAIFEASWGTYRPQATTQMNFEDFSLFAGWWFHFFGGISTWLLMKGSNLTTVMFFQRGRVEITN